MTVPNYTPNPDIPPVAPSIFILELPPEDLSTQVSEKLPNSDGGMIEAVKRAVLVALRTSFQDSSMALASQGTQVSINLEYPLTEEQYPGIWVQFSVSKLQRMGLSQEVWQLVDGNWQAIQEWMFEGRVTLTILALTNLERDRIADSLVTMMAFSRTPDPVITKPSDTKQYKSFITSLDQNPYVSMTVNTDILIPGGQSVNLGVPWQDDVPAYIDTYSFNLLGQFNYIFNHDGTYTLSAIDPYPGVFSGWGEVRHNPQPVHAEAMDPSYLSEQALVSPFPSVPVDRDHVL